MGQKVALAAAMLVLLAAALVLRLPRLGDRPFHGDEAVHAAKFRDLWQHGRYVYDPDEYHGPTIYYAALPVVATRGRTTFAATQEADYRLPLALLGAVMVLLLPLLHDGLGIPGMLWAALFLSVSAPFVFYSRTFIQETALAAFTLALIACGWRYHRSGRTGWLIGAATAAGLIIATKETSVLTFGALGLAWLTTRRRDDPGPSTHPTTEDGLPPSLRRRRAGTRAKRGCGGDEVSPRLPDYGRLSPLPRGSWRGWFGSTTADRLIPVALLALSVAYVLLSGFFSHPAGPLGYFETYTPWLRRAAGTDLHRHPWHYYLTLLAWQQPKGGGVWTELLVLILAAVGALTAISRRWVEHAGGNPGFARWMAVYSVVLCAVYSAIPYKTPWNLLSFYLGFLLLAGLGAAALVSRLRPLPAKIVLTLGLLGGTGHLAWQSGRTTFHYRDDQTSPYAYAQPMHGVREIEQRVAELAAFRPQKNQTVAQVIFRDGYYWPLPWYLRRLEHVGYWTGKVPPEAEARLTSTPILLCSAEFDAELSQRLNASHFMIGFHSLRPGVLVQMWVKNELWEPFVMSRPRSSPAQP